MSSNPYRERQPESIEPHGTSPSLASAVVVVVILTWLILGDSEPTRRELILWTFTTVLCMLIVLVWRRGDPRRKRND